MKIRATQELTGAWEVWEFEVPDGSDLGDFSTLPLDNGVLIDSGFDSCVFTAVEVAPS